MPLPPLDADIQQGGRVQTREALVGDRAFLLQGRNLARPSTQGLLQAEALALSIHNLGSTSLCSQCTFLYQEVQRSVLKLIHSTRLSLLCGDSPALRTVMQEDLLLPAF